MPCGRLTDRQQSLNWLQLYWRAGRVIARSDPLHTGFMVYDSFDIVTEKGVSETTGGFIALNGRRIFVSVIGSVCLCVNYGPIFLFGVFSGFVEANGICRGDKKKEQT